MPHAEANGARLYYETHGEGPPLLIHPGWGATIELFFANVPALAKRYRVIIFDPRGAGRSTTAEPDGGATMETYADDAAGVLDAAGVQRAHVYATSFGGMVAQNFALRHPGRVAGLVLACTTPGGSRHVLPPLDRLQTFLAAATIEDPAAAVRSTFPLHYSDAYARDHGHEIEGRAMAAVHLRSTAEGRAAQLAAVQTHDTFDRLPEITSPTLVAHGDDDGIVPFENAKMLADRIPNARLRTYEGARHIFFVERAEELNADIMSFLADHPL